MYDIIKLDNRNPLACQEKNKKNNNPSLSNINLLTHNVIQGFSPDSSALKA
jgi:hypothetical protein